MLPCPFHYFTGLDCPACGGQRMVLALLHGDIIEAFLFNPFLFVAIPATALWWWYKGELSSQASLVLLLLFMAWGVVRNIIPH